MKRPTDFDAIYLSRDHVDFRKWIDGLVAVVEDALHLKVDGRYLFAFCSRRRDRIKILYWDGSGYAVWYKRLEAETFKWPRKATTTVVTMTAREFEWLLEGFDVARMTPHQTLHFTANS